MYDGATKNNSMHALIMQKSIKEHSTAEKHLQPNIFFLQQKMKNMFPKCRHTNADAPTIAMKAYIAEKSTTQHMHMHAQHNTNTLKT